MSTAEQLPIVQVRFPNKFSGVFRRTRPRFEPLLATARNELRALPMPPAIRPYYDYGVLAHEQPSFMLLPLMFLSIAERHGGITRRHEEYLPWHLLAMEVAAVLDDTVDRTPYRSGRMTYVKKFGEPSATSFACFLYSIVVERTHAVAPEVLPMLTSFFKSLCALETWNYHSRYPTATEEGFEDWLEHRYGEVGPGIAHTFNAALGIHGRAHAPEILCTKFGEIMQDVDDVVNLLEQRELEGENDDIKMGMVTHPLYSAVRADPSLLADVERLWTPYRSISRNSIETLPAQLEATSRRTAAQYARVAEKVLRYGIPATLEKIRADAQTCIDVTEEPLRSCVREIVEAFVERVAVFRAAPLAS